MDNRRIKLLMATVGAFFSWVAIILQFILLLENRTETFPETIVRFFSYYTILTNLLVACCFTALVFKREHAKSAFFTNSRVLGATAVYITVVGAVYNIILRYLWVPQGLQLVVDELLHTVDPLYFLTFWMIFAPKAGLTWKHVFSWMIYPLVYLIFILVRGAFSGFYPYPFINVTDLGWNHVLRNSAAITAAFVILSLIIIGISKAVRRKMPNESNLVSDCREGTP